MKFPVDCKGTQGCSLSCLLNELVDILVQCDPAPSCSGVKDRGDSAASCNVVSDLSDEVTE